VAIAFTPSPTGRRVNRAVQLTDALRSAH
jgi:hypothetical protein